MTSFINALHIGWHFAHQQKKRKKERKKKWKWFAFYLLISYLMVKWKYSKTTTVRDSSAFMDHVCLYFSIWYNQCCVWLWNVICHLHFHFFHYYFFSFSCLFSCSINQAGHIFLFLAETWQADHLICTQAHWAFKILQCPLPAVVGEALVAYCFGFARTSKRTQFMSLSWNQFADF